jgi:hypothetical protein
MNKRAKRRLRGKLRSLKITDFFTLEQLIKLADYGKAHGLKAPYTIYIGGKQFNFN